MTCNKECLVCGDCKAEFLRLIDKHPAYTPIKLITDKGVDEKVLGTRKDA